MILIGYEELLYEKFLMFKQVKASIVNIIF